MNKVAITKCGKYEYELIRKAVGLLADNSDFPDVKGKTVLVKPNILSDSKMEKNITTNPLVQRYRKPAHGERAQKRGLRRRGGHVGKSGGPYADLVFYGVLIRRGILGAVVGQQVLLV